MRGKYERSPFFRLHKTDSLSVMFFGYYHGIKENKEVTIMSAAKMFCDKFPNCDIDASDMISGYQRLTEIMRDVQKKK